MAELGFKGVTVYSWQAFAAPKGPPADIKAKLHAVLVAGRKGTDIGPEVDATQLAQDLDYHVPFGGRKGSSDGPREQGRYAAEFCTTVKTACTQA